MSMNMKLSDKVEKALSDKLKQLSNPDEKGDYMNYILSDQEREQAIRYMLTYTGKTDDEKVLFVNDWNDKEMITANYNGLLF